MFIVKTLVGESYAVHGASDSRRSGEDTLVDSDEESSSEDELPAPIAMEGVKRRRTTTQGSS